MRTALAKLLAVTCLLATTCALKGRCADGSGETYVTEMIVPFDMPMDDLKIAASEQLSRDDFKTSSFEGSNITVSKLVYKTTYNGSERVLTPPYLMNHAVTIRQGTRWSRMRSMWW
jgi:hypothetical protein